MQVKFTWVNLLSVFSSHWMTTDEMNKHGFKIHEIKAGRRLLGLIMITK